MTVLFPKRRKTNRFTLIQFNIGCEGLEIKGDWHPQTVQWKRCPIKIRPFSGVSMISICGFKKSVMYNRPMRLSAGCTEQPHHCSGVGSSLSSVFMHTPEQYFSCTCFKYHLGKNIVFSILCLELSLSSVFISDKQPLSTSGIRPIRHVGLSVSQPGVRSLSGFQLS